MGDPLAAGRRRFSPGLPIAAARRRLAPRSIAARWATTRGLTAPGSIATRRATGGLVRPWAIPSRWAAGRFGPPAFAWSPIGRASARLAGITTRCAGAVRGFIGPGPIAARRAAARGATAPGSIATRGPARRGFVRPWLTVAAALRPHAVRAILLLESIARILVHAAGAPILAAVFLVASPRRIARGRAGRRLPFTPFVRPGGRALAPLKVFALELLRLPQPAACEPLHLGVRVLALQLVERRQQFFLLPRAKRRRLVVDEDGPVRVARRHALLWQGSGIRDRRIRDRRIRASACRIASAFRPASCA